MDADTAWYMLHFLDWRQTHYIASNCHEYREYNPVLRDCPRRGEINKYFMGAALAYTGLVFTLPKEYLSYFRYGALVVTGQAVINNSRIGIQINF